MTEERVPYMGKSSNKPTLVVRDDGGDLRKYRIELPNIVDDSNLSVYAFRLYVHFKRVAGANGGICYQGARTLASICNMSASTISEAKTELVAKNLIRIEPGGKGKTDTIWIVDIWRENFAKYSKTTDREAISSDREAISSDREAISSDREAIKRSNPIKKEPIKKEPNEEDGAAAQPAPKPSGDPLIQAFRETFRRYPNHGQIEEILKVNPPIKNWIGAIKEWNLRGNKPTNVKGMLEWALNPSLMERFSGNTNTKETMRNRKEASDGEDEDNGGWDADELAAIKAARAAGDYALAGQIGREGNKRWKERMSQVQGHRLDGR